MEYAIFIAVAAAALITMNDYVRRSIQANLKVLEDNINAEAGAPVTVTPPAPLPGSGQPPSEEPPPPTPVCGPGDLVCP